MVALKSFLLQFEGKGILDALNFIFADTYLISFIATSVLGAAGSYVINDIYDLEIDKINRPERILPSGLLNLNEAKYLYSALVTLSLLSACAIYYHTQIFAFIVIALGLNFSFWLYAKYLKSTVILGNFFVSVSSIFMIPIMTFATILKSGSQFNQYQIIFTIVFSLFAFFVSMARELVKDWQDMEGDEKHNTRTFPIVYGENKTILLTLIFLFSIVVLSSLLIYFHSFLPNGGIFASYQLFFVAVPTVYICFKLIYSEEDLNPSKLSRWLKFLMMSGMASMILF